MKKSLFGGISFAAYFPQVLPYGAPWTPLAEQAIPQPHTEGWGAARATVFAGYARTGYAGTRAEEGHAWDRGTVRAALCLWTEWPGRGAVARRLRIRLFRVP